MRLLVSAFSYSSATRRHWRCLFPAIAGAQQVAPADRQPAARLGGRLSFGVRPRIQIPMIPNFFTNLSVRLHPFRRALIAGLLFVISAIFAFVFLLVVPGRVALPTLMLFAVPLLVILWASICCASWFHPEHGRLSINRFSGRKQPAAVQSFARWYAATFLVIFVLAGVLGPLVLFR